ncbi:MAG: 30S ribosome-binding factor RbfA [Oscillospiraceae bacterium]|nr:30S ribosome-binding factor RbfA [Oscillospiraceae bacterium]
MPRKHEHLETDIKRELAAVMRELKDPGLHDSVLSIVHIDLSGDLSYCKVYISTIDGMEKTKQAAEVLTKASGLIRKEIFTRLSLRRAPELKFIPDDSVEYSAHINELLKKEI